MAEARSGNKVGGARLICVFCDRCGCNRCSVIVGSRAIYDQLVHRRARLLSLIAAHSYICQGCALFVEILSARAISV